MRVCVPQPDNSSQHPQNQRPLLPPAQQHLGHTTSAFARVLRVRRISTLFIRASLTQVTLSSNVFLTTQTPRLSLFRHSARREESLPLCFSLLRLRVILFRIRFTLEFHSSSQNSNVILGP